VNTRRTPPRRRHSRRHSPTATAAQIPPYSYNYYTFVCFLLQFTNHFEPQGEQQGTFSVPLQVIRLTFAVRVVALNHLMPKKKLMPVRRKQNLSTLNSSPHLLRFLYG